MGILDQLFPLMQSQESGNDPTAVSPKGAFGLMQLMPATATDPGFGVTPFNPSAPDLNKENQRVGRDYFSALYNKYGDAPTALMAYNWGPGNVDKWLASNGTIPVPKETQNYVAKIMTKLAPAQAQAQPMTLGPAPAPAPQPDTGSPTMADNSNGGGSGILGGLTNFLKGYPTADQPGGDYSNLGPMLLALGAGIAGGSGHGWGPGIGAGLENAQNVYIQRLGMAMKMRELELERRKALAAGIKDVPSVSGRHQLYNVDPETNVAMPVDTGGGSPMNILPAAPGAAAATAPAAPAPAPAAPAPVAAAPAATADASAPQFNEDALTKYTSDPDVQNRARAMAVGDLPIPASSRNNPLNNEALSALLAYTNGKPDTSAYARKTAMALAQSTGDIGKAANAFRAVTGHISEAVDSINALNNGTYPIKNVVKNAYATEIGGPTQVDRANKVKQLQQNIDGLASEAEKVWEVGGGSEGALNAWKENFPINGARQTQIAALQKLIDMIRTKAQAIQEQVNLGVKGTSTPPLQIITPQLNAVLDGIKKLSTSAYEVPTPASIKLIQQGFKNKDFRKAWEDRFGPADQYLKSTPLPTMGM